MKAYMKVTYWVMTIFAYLILSILFWQEAWAGPLDEQAVSADSMFTIGYLSDNYEELYGKYVLITAINSAASAQATGFCTMGTDVDWSCQEEMHTIILSAIAWWTESATGDSSYNAVADAFWIMCANLQESGNFDRSWPVGELADLFVAVASSSYREAQKKEKS